MFENGKGDFWGLMGTFGDFWGLLGVLSVFSPGFTFVSDTQDLRSYSSNMARRMFANAINQELVELIRKKN